MKIKIKTNERAQNELAIILLFIMLIIPTTFFAILLPRDPSTIYNYKEDQIKDLFSTSEDVVIKDSNYLGTESKMIFTEGKKDNTFDYCTFYIFNNEDDVKKATDYLLNNYSIIKNDENTIYAHMPSTEGIVKGAFIIKGNIILYTYKSQLDFLTNDEFELRVLRLYNYFY